jgi:hypothetical protein
MITVTLFSPSADGGARVLSYQHADPRGSVPAGVVNMLVTRGKEQLKDMRQHMVRQRTRWGLLGKLSGASGAKFWPHLRRSIQVKLAGGGR